MPVAAVAPVIHVKAIKASVTKAAKPCKIEVKTLADGTSIRTVSVNNRINTVELIGPKVTNNVQVHVATDVQTVTE